MLTLHPETLRQPVAARIAQFEAALAAAKQEQRVELLLAIANRYPAGEVFSVTQLWQQDDLRTAFDEAGIHSPKQLGKWLQQDDLVDRVGRDGDGILWSVSADDLHDDASDP